MSEIDPKKNYGILPPPVNDKEWVMGAVSGIVFEKRNTIADWRGFLPTEERQKFRNFDSFGCASFSCLNSVETQFHFLIKSGLLRQDDLDWLKEKGYFDENGKINFSDRWLVVLSGTKPGVGNYIHAVWDAARKFGLVPQSHVPFREDMTQVEYYNKSDFTKDTYDLGQEFLKRFYVRYERVATDDSSVKKALEQAPVQCGIATCQPWETDQTILYCGLPANHAIILTRIDSVKFLADSYPPFQKKLSCTYKIDFAYKGVISPRISVGSQTEKKQFMFEKDLKFGNYDNDVVQLSRLLIEENYWPDTNFNPPSPHYGPEVARAVRAYQKQNGITNWWEDFWQKGKYCGPKTRLSLNSKPLTTY